MVEGFEELNLIIDQELANGFWVKLLVDNLETDLTELLVVSLEDCGGETSTNFLKFRELVNDSFMGLIHAVFFDI